eukprot:g6367.t1
MKVKSCATKVAKGVAKAAPQNWWEEDSDEDGGAAEAAGGLGQQIILRRLNKFVATQPGAPSGAQWTGATLPPALLADSKALYTKHGSRLERAHAVLIEKDSRKFSYETLCKTFGAVLVFLAPEDNNFITSATGKNIKDACRLDAASNQWNEFAAKEIQAKRTSGPDWETQTDALKEKIRVTDEKAAKRALFNTAKVFSFKEEVTPVYLHFVVLEFLAVAMQFCPYRVSGYCFYFFKEILTALKESVADKAKTLGLIERKGKYANAEPSKCSTQNFWHHTVPKLKRQADKLQVTTRLRILLFKKAILSYQTNDSTGEQRLVLNIAGDHKTHVMESPMRKVGLASSKSTVASEADVVKKVTPKTLMDDPDFALPIDQLESWITASCTPSEIHTLLFSAIYPDWTYDAILEQPIENFYWMNLLGGLEGAGETLKEAHKELQKVTDMFLPRYALLKHQSEACCVIFGLGVVKKVGYAAYYAFLTDVKEGRVEPYLAHINKMQESYCKKLNLVCDDVAILSNYSTYADICEGIREVKTIYKEFKQLNAGEDIAMAITGYLCQLLMGIHQKTFKEIKQLVVDGDIDAAYRLYKESRKFEENSCRWVDTKKVWQELRSSPEGQKMLEYNPQKISLNNKDADGDENMNGNEEDGIAADGDSGLGSIVVAHIMCS